jgi:hypothetical protein
MIVGQLVRTLHRAQLPPPHEIGDATFLSWAAIVPEVDDVRRPEPAEATIPERRRDQISTVLLRQDLPPIEVVTITQSIGGSHRFHSSYILPNTIKNKRREE